MNSWSQELYAGLEGHVKDPSGAIVQKATVEVTSPALMGAKKAQTDAAGYFRISNLPSGDYTISVTAQGFRGYKQGGIQLSTGRFPTIDITLRLGSVTETVEVSGEAPVIDLTESKVQTVMNQQTLQDIPKGTSYQSVIQFAPGARQEPMEGAPGGTAGVSNTMGYKVDGATNSENSYLVEGQETANPQYGVAGVNVPMEFIQEVQIKSSGFEAEHGGAMGGVVNVIQKRGTNNWHGGVYATYEGDGMDAAPDKVLRKNPDVAASTALRLDSPAQYWQPKKDNYTYLYPGFDVGGPFIKDRLWGFASFVPSMVNVHRTVNFTQAAGGPATLNGSSTTYYSFARLDFMATQNIRLFGSWQDNYERTSGATLLPYGGNQVFASNPLPDDVFGARNTIASNGAQQYNNSIGYVRPMMLYNFGADITINSNIVSTTRFGRSYQDYEDRGLPTGNRFLYTDTNYPYATGNVAQVTAATTNLAGVTLSTAYPGFATMAPGGASLAENGGWANIGVNYGYQFDKYTRYSFDQNFSILKKFAGIHNFKVGYGFHHITNDVSDGYNSSLTYIAIGVPYAPTVSGGSANCAAIVAQNVANGWAAGGTQNSCQGLWGTVNFRDLATTGKVGSWNHGMFFQDAWTVNNRLTLNLGVRLDKENLPSYNDNFKGISFGWGSKVAPRLGASYDVLGNRKLKAYASYGWFYDIMKFELPRGSFGGDYWHDCVYALDSLSALATLNPTRDANAHYCPLGTGAATFSTPGLRFIENTDYRQPSNDPNSPGSLGSNGLIDPNLKPTKEHEMVMGLDWEINPKLALETRYSRKVLDRTIEDTGVITPAGEAYYISNPGFGADATLPSCPSCPANPKAKRNYDGLEFRLTQHGSAKWFGTVSYTYSRLRGNYNGLTNSDVSDGGAGRQSPDVGRAFDEPYMQFDASGHVIDGPLATDRPHAFKAYGYYTLKWHKMETHFGAFQQAYSGTPLSSYVSIEGAPVFVAGRGEFVNLTRDASGNWVVNGVTAKRTPWFSQTDLNLSHEIHVNRSNETQVLGFELNVLNVLNQHSPIYYNQNMIRSGSLKPAEFADGSVDYKTLMTGYKYLNAANATGGTATVNSLYGLPYGWQDGRTMRLKVRFTF